MIIVYWRSCLARQTETDRQTLVCGAGMRPGPSDFPRPDCVNTAKDKQNETTCPNATNPGTRALETLLVLIV